MKFLLAIKNTESDSRNILDIGCKIAEGFSADLTICYIGKKSQSLIEGDVNLARKSLAEWNIHHPGLEVLEWAYSVLKEKGFADDTEFNVQNLVEEEGRIRMVLPMQGNYQIRLVLREGELLTELNREVKRGEFDLAILGAPDRKRMTHKFAQFLETSIFFVKNFQPHWKYKILLCVDDSRATKRAVIFSTRISKQFNAPIISLTVSKTSFFGKGYRNAHSWAERYLKRVGIPFESKFSSGDPVEVFIQEAGSDHIIIMGKAKGSELLQFARGSKPIHTAQQANCPVLLVQ
ncbi:MAG: universal stress protein [Candidatus Marinimicrobia bacterium]|jgi:nucleotide-binding universal stress UspA family protein|nr:universal stress protein [Candidatus Neomarinimicrobiota bacterium]